MSPRFLLVRRVVVPLLTALVAVVPAHSAHAQPKYKDERARLNLRLSYDYSMFNNFESVVGNQPNIGQFKADQSVSGPGFGLEFQPARFPLRVQTGFSRGTQNFTQVFLPNQNGLQPLKVTGQVDGWFVDVGVAYARVMEQGGFYFSGGTTYARNESEFDSEYSGCLQCTSTLTRVVSGFKPRFGLGADLRVNRHWGARLSADHIGSFSKNDADDHYRVSAGVMYSWRFAF